MSALTSEREKEIREMYGGHMPAVRDVLAALDECRRKRDVLQAAVTAWKQRVNDDSFLRYRDSITETLRLISTHAGSGDYSQVIADMATELLGDLGQT